jgi:hypothetical protein
MSLKFVVGLIYDARDGKASIKGVVQKAGPNHPDIIVMRLAIIRPSAKKLELIETKGKFVKTYQSDH